MYLTVGSEKVLYLVEPTFTIEYTFNSDGTLRLSNSPFGLDLIYVKNPGYQPKKHIY